MASGRRTAKAAGLVLLVALAPASSRADLTAPEEAACQRREAKPGDPCPTCEGFLGNCQPYTDVRGRDRMRCEPPGPPLTEVQRACRCQSAGSACARPSGVDGVCVEGERRPLDGERELVLLECRRAPKPPVPIWPVAAGLAALAATIAALRWRKR